MWWKHSAHATEAQKHSAHAAERHSLCSRNSVCVTETQCLCSRNDACVAETQCLCSKKQCACAYIMCFCLDPLYTTYCARCHGHAGTLAQVRSGHRRLHVISVHFCTPVILDHSCARLFVVIRTHLCIIVRCSNGYGNLRVPDQASRIAHEPEGRSPLKHTKAVQHTYISIVIFPFGSISRTGATERSLM